MKKIAKIALLAQLALMSGLASAQAARDVYSLNAQWVHSAPSAAIIHGNDVMLTRSATNQSESLGRARIRIVGALSEDCKSLAGLSAAGNAHLHLFTAANSAVHEISDIPTYVIDTSKIYSCGLRKN
jgi:hypothetical protein